jgi:3-dehydrosphinganine reductase
MTLDYFQGKKVYITGGSSGIGLAAARHLVTAGAHVAISARGKQRLDEAATALSALKRGDQRLLATVCDVSDPADCRRTTEKVLAELGGIDVVIANAGVAHPARVLDTPDEIYRKMININYLGTVFAIRPFLPALFAQRSGRIGVTSSLLGFMGIYGYTAYAASKFAQVGFIECLRQECLDYGVTVTLVYPPDTDTPQLVEEDKIKPPETRAISGEVKTMSPADVSAAYLAGIANGDLHVVPGSMGKFTHFMYRHVPGVVHWTIDGALKKFRKQNPAPPPSA